MTGIGKFFITLVLTVIFSGPLMAEASGSDLNSLADDRRFSDAVQFVKLGRDDRALQYLGEYLEIFDRGAHRDEAWRLIAEIHSRRFQYQRAAEIYLRLYSEYSYSEQGISAYFQAALCYMKMGMNARAESILKDIIERSPDSSAAAHAATRLEILKLTENR